MENTDSKIFLIKVMTTSRAGGHDFDKYYVLHSPTVTHIRSCHLTLVGKL